MRIRTVGAGLFHSDKQRNERMDGQTQKIKLKVVITISKSA